MKNKKIIAESLLESVGIKINGNNPWDIKIHNENFYKRILAGGSLALGESYMEGWWDCEKIDEFFYKILGAKLNEKMKTNFSVIAGVLKAKFFNLQSKSS